ncbi:MAG: PilZ domain-containing protein [Deltaproteobacteria bacterium]|nr:PilZ domain-containing protein [Deltaproteobacteria bacterium]
MAKLIERRKFRRFEIPDSKVKIMLGLGSSFIRPFLKQYPLLNIGMGGINFISTREFIKGEELVIELNAPEEGQIELLLRVIWTNPVTMSKDLVTGSEFFPFGEERHMNSPDAMNTLRRLYARYVEG